MTRCRRAALAVAIGASVALAGCGNLVTRDLNPPSQTSSDDGSTATPTATTAPGGVAAPAGSTTSGSQPAVATVEVADVERIPGVVASGLLTPAPVATVKPGTFALGDSFLLGSKKTMVAHHIRVDAKVGRQFFQGITVLRAVSRTGTLPRNVVVHLGTNGTVTRAQCENVVATAGPHRRLFLVTVLGPRSWMKGDDVVLHHCAAAHHTQVVLVDWASIAAAHPGWFGPDHIHPNPTGRPHYNALLLAALAHYGL